MTIQYLKDSFKKIGDRVIEYKIKNTEGSAKVNVSPSVFLDDQDITGGTSISVKEGKFIKIRDKMDLDILYGDVITLRSELNKSIEKGSHKIKIEMKVNWPIWTTLVSEFRVKIT